MSVLLTAPHIRARATRPSAHAFSAPAPLPNHRLIVQSSPASHPAERSPIPVSKEQFAAMADQTNLPAGATVRNVRIMKEVVGDEVQVKAAGGIRDTATARRGEKPVPSALPHSLKPTSHAGRRVARRPALFSSPGPPKPVGPKCAQTRRAQMRPNPAAGLTRATRTCALVLT